MLSSLVSQERFYVVPDNIHTNRKEFRISIVFYFFDCLYQVFGSNVNLAVDYPVSYSISQDASSQRGQSYRQPSGHASLGCKSRPQEASDPLEFSCCCFRYADVHNRRACLVVGISASAGSQLPCHYLSTFRARAQPYGPECDNRHVSIADTRLHQP